MEVFWNTTEGVQITSDVLSIQLCVAFVFAFKTKDVNPKSAECRVLFQSIESVDSDRIIIEIIQFYETKKPTSKFCNLFELVLLCSHVVRRFWCLLCFLLFPHKSYCFIHVARYIPNIEVRRTSSQCSCRL